MESIEAMFFGWPVHLTVGLVIFFVVNWIGKHSTHIGYDFLNSVTEPENAPGFNLIFRIFTPVVVLILISAGLYGTGFDDKTENIHHAILYYIAIRLIFNIIIRQRGNLAPWGRMIFQWFATIILSHIAYKYVISEREYLFPDVDTLGNEIWLLLIGYGYILAKSVGNSDGNRSRRVSKYISGRLNRFIEKYDKTITKIEPNPNLVSLVYSIMIVEDFNRPKSYRILEWLLFPTGCVKTLGLMQVTTKFRITDEESIIEGTRIIQSLLDRIVREGNWKISQSKKSNMSSEAIAAHEESDIIHRILVGYNPSGDYARDVESVFEEVRKRYCLGRVAPIHIVSDRQGSNADNSDWGANSNDDHSKREIQAGAERVEGDDGNIYFFAKTGEEFCPFAVSCGKWLGSGLT